MSHWAKSVDFSACGAHASYTVAVSPVTRTGGEVRLHAGGTGATMNLHMPVKAARELAALLVAAADQSDAWAADKTSEMHGGTPS